MRGTIKDMATTVQNLFGVSQHQAFDYIISEAEWVRDYYKEQEKSDAPEG